MTHATRHDPYGMTLVTGTGGGTPVGADAWKYQGRLDVSPEGLATPLYDLSARFYAPGLSAFTQADTTMGTAQDPLSMNRFLYAEGNPATLIDPTGHRATACDVGYDCTNGGQQVVNDVHKRPSKHHSYLSHRSTSSSSQAQAADARESAAHASASHAYAVTLAVTAAGGGFDPLGPGKWLAGLGVGLVKGGVDTGAGIVGAALDPAGTAQGLAYVASSVTDSVTSGKAADHLVTGWNYWWSDKRAATHTGDAFQDGMGASSAAWDIFNVGLTAYGGVSAVKGAVSVGGRVAGAVRAARAGSAVEDAAQAARGVPRLSPKFRPPTNPPQYPPAEIPPGWRVRQMPPTEQYPNGYWRLEKPMSDGSWQPIDPSTMRPGGRPDTHIPLPPRDE